VNGLVLSTVFLLQSVTVSFSKPLSESLSVIGLSCFTEFDVITYCHMCLFLSVLPIKGGVERAVRFECRISLQ